MTAICAWILAIIAVAILVGPAGISAASSSEDSSNFTTSTRSPEPITFNVSNLTLNNQTSNRTDDTPKPNTTSQGNLSRVIIITNTSISFPYEVTVRFDSITVHENHETTPLNAAEYDLSAFVQGILVDLTESSTRGEIHIGSEMPLTGLGDASESETVYFDPGTEVTVYLPKTLPLSIFTVGQEVDLCGIVDFDKPLSEYYRERLVESYKGQPLNWLEAIDKYLNRMVPSDDLSLICAIDSNDRLGNLIKFYGPVDYGAGAHTNVVSSSRDFTLRYTITVKPPPTGGWTFEAQPIPRNATVVPPGGGTFEAQPLPPSDPAIPPGSGGTFETQQAPICPQGQVLDEQSGLCVLEEPEVAEEQPQVPEEEQQQSEP